MKIDINEIKNILNIINISSEDIIDNKKQLYEKFKREYTLFLSLVYKRLKEEELIALSDGVFKTGEYKLSFGTDEFVYEYKTFDEISMYIDIIENTTLSIENCPNTLVYFKQMFKDFFNILRQPFNSEEALEMFGELTKCCLDRLGFNDIEISTFDNSIIIEIDICTRIAKTIKQMREEKQTPNKSFPIEKRHIINYIKTKLENWSKEFGNNGSKRVK